MSYHIPESQGVVDERAKAIGEAVRALHRAGWHDLAKRIADDAREMGQVKDYLGSRLVQSQESTRTHGLVFHDAEKELPPDSGDKRKLVWLEDFDGMAWWGIRVHVTRNEWFNNNQPEMARVKLWADLPPHAGLLITSDAANRG